MTEIEDFICLHLSKCKNDLDVIKFSKMLARHLGFCVCVACDSDIEKINLLLTAIEADLVEGASTAYCESLKGKAK